MNTTLKLKRLRLARCSSCGYLHPENTLNKEPVKVNDTVRLVKFPQRSINAFARVVRVMQDGVYVSNMNMPFSGTLAREFIPNGDYTW